MTYNLSLNTTTTLADVYVLTNNITDGLLSYGLLLMVLSMVYFGTKRYGATQNQAYIAALTTTTLVAGALTIIGVVNDLLFAGILMATVLVYIMSFHN